MFTFVDLGHHSTQQNLVPSLSSPFIRKGNNDNNNFPENGFKRMLEREIEGNHLPERMLPLPILRNNSNYEIVQYANNSHTIATFSAAEQKNNSKSFSDAKDLLIVTSPDKNTSKAVENVKTLEINANNTKHNNISKINDELVVLKENTNNKSLSKIVHKSVSVAKDNRNDSLNIDRRLNSKAVEHDDVFEESVITLANSISLLDDASYNNVGAKNSLAEAVTTHLPPTNENELDLSQITFGQNKDLQFPYVLNQTLTSEIRNKNASFDFQQVYENSNSTKVIPYSNKARNNTMITEGSTEKTKKILTGLKEVQKLKEFHRIVDTSYLSTNSSANQERYSDFELDNMLREESQENPNILPPAVILQINSTNTDNIDFSKSDNYTKSIRIASQADDIFEDKESPMNYTGRSDIIRKSNVNNVKNIIKKMKITSKSAVVPENRRILRTQKPNKMPPKRNLYLKRFRECIKLGRRCRWS